MKKLSNFEALRRNALKEIRGGGANYAQAICLPRECTDNALCLRTGIRNCVCSPGSGTCQLRMDA